MTECVKTADLFGFGIAAVDDLIEVASYPPSGDKTEVLARRRQGGGLCTTALVAAARLGMRCVYGGLLGHNELSDFTRATLHKEGIATTPDAAYPEAEPFHSWIIVDRSSGERTILYSRERVVTPQPSDVPVERIASSRALFVDHLGVAAALHACEIAREAGVPSIADIENTADQDIARLIALVDHLILPLRVGKILSGCESPVDAIRALARNARPCTVLTDGARGCWYLEQGTDEVKHQAALPVEVVDTTGCGDVFHGAYAAGLVLGMTIPDTIRFAAATAAIKATRPGGQWGIPDRAMVEAFLTVHDARAQA